MHFRFRDVGRYGEGALGSADACARTFGAISIRLNSPQPPKKGITKVRSAGTTTLHAFLVAICLLLYAFVCVFSVLVWFLLNRKFETVEAQNSKKGENKTERVDKIFTRKGQTKSETFEERAPRKRLVWALSLGWATLRQCSKCYIVPFLAWYLFS